MTRIWGLAGLAIAIGAVAGASVGAQSPPLSTVSPLRIGLPESMFRDMAPDLIQSAAERFEAMLQKIAGLKGSTEIVTSYSDLATKMKDGKLDLGVFHGFEYAWVKDTPGLTPLAVAVPNSGKVQACLVVRVNSKAKEPKDLKGACVAIPKGCQPHCLMFLERTQAKLPQDSCRPAKLDGLTPAETFDAVVDGRCEAALATVSSFLTYQNNTPGLGRQLKILATSEVLPPPVVVYRKGALSPPEVETIRKGLLNCTKTAGGRTLTTFWQLKGFEDVTDVYKKQIEECLKTYPPPANVK